MPVFYKIDEERKLVMTMGSGVLYAAIVESGKLYDEIRSTWQSSAKGLDLSPALSYVLKEVEIAVAAHGGIAIGPHGECWTFDDESMLFLSCPSSVAGISTSANPQSKQSENSGQTSIGDRSSLFILGKIPVTSPKKIC